MNKTTAAKKSCDTSHPIDLQASAFLAKSLSDVNRLRILLSINEGQKSVSVIVEELELSQPLVSHHLKELRRALLVTVERKGPFVFYKMADERIAGIIEKLNELAKDLITNRNSF